MNKMNKFKVIILCLIVSFLSGVVHATDVGGYITDTTVWTTAWSPYVVTSSITLGNGISMSIEPWVVVKFNAWTNFTVQWTLEAGSVSGEPVIFTSIKDDTAGWDTNWDTTSTIPLARDWWYIKFNGSGSDGSVLDNVEISYGWGRYGLVRIYNSSPTIKNSIIRDVYKYAIYITNGSPIIENNDILDSSIYGIYISNGTPNIKGNTITNGSYGIWINGGESILEGNTISNSSSYGLFIAWSWWWDMGNNTISNAGAYGVYISTTWNMVFSGNIVDSNGWTNYDGLYVSNGTGKIINNEIKNNAKSGIYLIGWSFEIKDNNVHDNVVSEIWLYNMEFLLSKYDFDIYEDNGIISNAYYVENFDISSMTGTILKKTKDIVVTLGWGLSSWKELKIESGNIIKVWAGKNITISGKLEAIGTVEQSIVFTSINDHSVWGSTGTWTPAARDWWYIKFNGSGSDGSVLDNVEISYGWGRYGLVRIYNSSPTIKNSIIRDVYKYAIYITNGSPIIENNDILDSSIYGIYIKWYPKHKRKYNYQW